MVFEQNTGVADSTSPSVTSSTCTGCPTHTFLLDAGQDASAGVEREDGAHEPRPGRRRWRRPGWQRPAGLRRSAAVCSATCSCCPAALWLFVFFVVPTVQPGRTSLYDPAGSLELGYQMTWRALELHRAPPGLLRAVPAVDGVRLAAPRSSASCSATRSRTRSRSRPAAGSNLMLVLVIAPFFTSFLIRTLVWKPILADQGFVVDDPAVPAHPRCRRPAAGHAARGGHRPDLQLPAVHGPAALRLAGEDRPAADGGRRRTSTPRRSRPSAR